MFYCDKCAEEMRWPKSIFKSFGPCEMCDKVAVCNDISSKHLPIE